MENYRIVRNEEKCVGCGVCVTKCPTRAWTRSEKKYYRLTLMGRTGKKNPRLGEDFLIWADEDTIIKVILNTYKFVKEYIDPMRLAVRNMWDTLLTEWVLQNIKNGHWMV